MSYSSQNPLNSPLLVKELVKCANFAAIKHKEQRSADNEATPYINHPVGVAFILTDEADVTDPNVIQAALLHDTIEVTDTTLDELKEQFGETIARIVQECTDDKKLPKRRRKQLQIEHAPTASREAKLVKLADKLYNLRDLERQTPMGWTQKRKTDYFRWAREVVKGLKGTNEAMEQELDKIFTKNISVDQ